MQWELISNIYDLVLYARYSVLFHVYIYAIGICETEIPRNASGEVGSLGIGCGAQRQQ